MVCMYSFSRGCYRHYVNFVITSPIPRLHWFYNRQDRAAAFNLTRWFTFRVGQAWSRGIYTYLLTRILKKKKKEESDFHAMKSFRNADQYIFFVTYDTSRDICCICICFTEEVIKVVMILTGRVHITPFHQQLELSTSWYSFAVNTRYIHISLVAEIGQIQIHIIY